MTSALDRVGRLPLEHTLYEENAVLSPYSEAYQNIKISQPSFQNDSVKIVDIEDASLKSQPKSLYHDRGVSEGKDETLSKWNKGLTRLISNDGSLKSVNSTHSVSSMTTPSTLSGIESDGSYQKPVATHGWPSAFYGSANPDEDWTKLSDIAERRRIQNRIAQRNHRKKLKRRLAGLERRAGPRSASPPETQQPQDLRHENGARFLINTYSTSEERSPTPPLSGKPATYQAPEEYGLFNMSWQELPAITIHGQYGYNNLNPHTPLSHSYGRSTTYKEYPITPAAMPELPRKRQRTFKKCGECRRRKQKCIPRKDSPCSNCARRFPPVVCAYDGGSFRSSAEDRVSEQHIREDTLVPRHKEQSTQFQVLIYKSKDSTDAPSDTSDKQSITESNFSGDETDEEEDPSDIDAEDQIFCDSSPVKRLLRNDLDDSDCIKPLLESVKEALINRIMGEFWTIYNQEWVSNIYQRGTTSPSQTTESSSGSFSGSPTRKPSYKGNKRSKGDDENEEDPGDGNWRDPKRLKSLDKVPIEPYKFSCPYRKYNPRKYSVANNWRSCALTPLESVARVKGHLYRHHRIYQCERCKDLFESTEDVTQHRKSVQACELSLAPEAEGITIPLEKRLRSRKKTHRDQSEGDRWREIYLILFPDTIVPSPYFEPIQEEPVIQSPGSQELTQYEEYARRELPRLVRSALDAMISDQTLPLEETLRAQLATIIRDCQDRVFSTYRGRSPPKTTDGTQMSANSGLDPLNDSAPSENTVEELCHLPPLQDNGIDLLPFTRQLENNQKDHSNPFADSGYGSNISSLTERTHSSLPLSGMTNSISTDISNLQPSQPAFGFPGDKYTRTGLEINQGIPTDLWAGEGFKMPIIQTFDWGDSWEQDLVAESAIPGTLPETS